MCHDAANAAHGLYRGVLYFQNVKRFYDARMSVILNTYMEKNGLRRADFDDTDTCLTTVCADVLYRIFSESVITCKNYE
jgi:hypothetical protein